jgi:hypothetical protein
MIGEAVGYVPCLDATESALCDEGRVADRMTYFVPDPCDCCDSFSRSLSDAWGTGEWGIPWELPLSVGPDDDDPELQRTRFSVDGNYGRYDLNNLPGETIASLYTTVSAVASHSWELPASVEIQGQFYDHGGYASLYDISWIVCGDPITTDNFVQLMYWSFGDYHIVFYVSPNNPSIGEATWAAWLNTDLATLPAGGYDVGDDAGPDSTFINSWIVEMSTESGRNCSGMTVGTYSGPPAYVTIDPSRRTASPTTAWGCSLAISSDSVAAQAWGTDDPSGPTVTIDATPSAPEGLIFQPARGIDIVFGVDIVCSDPC